MRSFFELLKSKIHGFGNLSPGRQLSIISVITLLLFLPVAVWIALQPTRPFSRAYLPATPPTEPGEASAVLSIAPELVFIAPGSEVELNVNIDAGSHEVTAADVILTFDKEIVSVEKVGPGDFLPVPLGKIFIDNNTGKLQFAVGEQPSSIKKGGTGTLATLKVKSKGKIGSSPFEFGDGTMVSAVGSDTSVLSSVRNGYVHVKEEETPSVSILLKFQGVSTQRPSQLVSYTASSVKSEGDSIKGESVAVGDANGKYKVVLSSVSPDTYDFTIKGPAHLSRILGRHTIPSSGEYIIDISDKPLVAGDIAPKERDDRISIIDYSLLVTDFGKNLKYTPADMDFDGDVDIFDYNMIVSNFGKTGDLYGGGPSCPQVTTPAKSPATGECREFSTPCDVPEGWEKVDSCSSGKGFGKAVKMVRNSGVTNSNVVGGAYRNDSTFSKWSQINPRGPMTLETWLRLDEDISPLDTTYFIYKEANFSYPSGPTRSTNYYLQLSGSRGLTLAVKDTQKQLIGFTSAEMNPDELKVGTWHHIAGVYDGRGIKLFIDGKERARQENMESTYPLMDDREALHLQGGPLGTIGSLPLTMDEVRISNTARYVTDFSPPKSPFVPDLNTLLLWHFDEQQDDGFFYSPDSSRTQLNAYLMWRVELVESTIPSMGK